MKEYKGLIVARISGPGRCGFCGNPSAKFVDIHFESHICNVKCSTEYWKEYLEACRRSEESEEGGCPDALQDPS
jgi:hypothetical protein